MREADGADRVERTRRYGLLYSIVLLQGQGQPTGFVVGGRKEPDAV